MGIRNCMIIVRTLVLVGAAVFFLGTGRQTQAQCPQYFCDVDGDGVWFCNQGDPGNFEYCIIRNNICTNGQECIG